MNIEETLVNKRNGIRMKGEDESSLHVRLFHLLKSLLRKIVMWLKIIVRTIFVIMNNIYCIPTFCVWILLLQPLRIYHPKLYWKIEGTFFHWLLAMVSMWSWSAGYDIVEMGDDIRLCLDSKTLVLVNHQSTADVPLLMACFNVKKGVLPNIMWIMDRVFKFTNFGIVSIVHEDFFILSGKDCRERAITLLKDHLKESYIRHNRKLLVLFPEGGFLRKRRETSKRFALQNNLPVLNNVSLPRMGAMHAIMEVVGSERNENTLSALGADDSHHSSSEHLSDGGDKGKDRLSWVVDITVAYPGGQPLDLADIVCGTRPPCQTILLYRVFPASQVPLEKEEITKWLFTLWQDKERILEQYYRTGEMPVTSYCNRPLPPQVVCQDNLRFLLLHLFFIVSTYLHVRLIIYAVSFVW